jgi:hypothetical protein
MIETVNERLYLEVSRELDIPIKTVKDVILNGQSKFTAFTMASNTFDGVRWPYFGAFKAKHKVVQVYNYMKGMTPEQKQFFKDMIYLRYQSQLLQSKQENSVLPPFSFNFNNLNNLNNLENLPD